MLEMLGARDARQRISTTPPGSWSGRVNEVGAVLRHRAAVVRLTTTVPPAVLHHLPRMPSEGCELLDESIVLRSRHHLG